VTLLTVTSGVNDPNDDVVQAYVTGPEAWPPQFTTADLASLRDEILGPMHERTPDPPSVMDGELVGGTHFERSPSRAHAVKEGTHCYQYMGLTTQRPNNITSPNLNSKGPEDRDTGLRARMLKVCCILIACTIPLMIPLSKVLTTAAVASLRQAPSKFLDPAKMQAELVNFPIIGTDENLYFGAFQLNIACCNSHEDHTLTKDLGHFGRMHVDRGDHEGYLSNLTVLSHLPTEYHPGERAFDPSSCQLKTNSRTFLPL
jgi:hypothetical protein